jgi:histidinol-phosphate/aromatic aminotransferase/cobyric acid decarboxylase-like protein
MTFFQKQSATQAPILRGPTPVNTLGAFNRDPKLAERHTHLSDGTPKTLPEVSATVSSHLGITDKKYVEAFNSMTYSPNMNGVNVPAVFAKAFPGLPPAIAVRPDRFESLKAANPSASDPEVISYDTYTTEVQSGTFQARLDRLQATSGTLRINFTKSIGLSPQNPEYARPVELALDFCFDHATRNAYQHIVSFVGPLLEPIAQLLVAHHLETGHPFEKKEIPTSPGLAESFLGYIKTKAPITDTHVMLSSGGCSGSLFEILKTLVPDGKHVVAQSPFFCPQGGIGYAAGHSFNLSPSTQALMDSLDSKPGAIVLTIPNNPDGEIPNAKDIQALVKKAKDTPIIVDFTYYNLVAPHEKANFDACIRALESAERHVFIASGSKSLALTKHRIAAVFGDPVSLGLLTNKLPKPNVLACIALDTALDPQNRDTVASSIQANIDETTEALTLILAATPKPKAGVPDPVKNVLTQPHYEPAYSTFNPALKAFAAIHQELMQLPEAATTPPLTITFGKGALYARLNVADYAQEPFKQLMEKHQFWLTPGSIFEQNPNDTTTPQSVLGSPQSWYRMALMNPIEG